MRKTLPLLALFGLAMAAGCGDETDDRPATRAYITAAILRPSCGTISCHSSSTKAAGYAFDTLEGVREAEQGGAVYPGDPLASPMVTVMRGGPPQMPPDSPVADKDIELIERWITNMVEQP